ncbi:MAG TPA: hypothetical protein VKO18_06995 [Terriglobia bacterium]|nr:hypothetical protein [Terriglobia bacterium]
MIELVQPPMARVAKKKGKKLRQNFLKLLKTHVEKMSVYRSLAMLMKPKKLKPLSGDVDENKVERRGTRNREKSKVARVTAYQLADAAQTSWQFKISSEFKEGLDTLHELAHGVANNVNERIHTLRRRNFRAVGIVKVSVG